MNLKIFTRICAALLVATSLFTFTACSGDGDGEGNIVSQTQTSGENNNKPGTSNNGNSNVSAEAKFATAYNNWVLSDVVGGFEKGVKNSSLPQDKLYSDILEQYKSGYSIISGIFFSEIKLALNAVKESEENKNFTDTKIKEVKRIDKGVYSVTMVDGSDNKKDADYKIMLSSEKKGICLIKYDENNKILSDTQIILTDDGYIAIQKCQRLSVDEKWESVQIMYKGEEGYFLRQEGLSESSAAIYQSSFPQEFAGKK